MSRAISRRYLLLSFVSAILFCGSSRRIPRSCPSCNQDCPEALTVRVPWYPQQSNLQSRIPLDFPINLLQNSIRPRWMQRISQDTVRNDDVLPNKNSMSFVNYKNLPQESQREDGNLLLKNLFNKFPKSLQLERGIFSRDNYMSNYPRVFPSRQAFDGSENLFGDPSDEYSESLTQDWNFQNYKKGTENKNKMQIVYRADGDTESWEQDLKDVSPSDIILPRRSFLNDENNFRFRRGDILNEENNLIKKSASPMSQQQELTYTSEKYNPARFDLSEVESDPRVFSLENLNMWNLPKTNKFFNNWDRSSDLEQIKQISNNNLFKEYSPREQDPIIINDDNDRMYNDYDSYTLFPDFNIWEPKKTGESIDNWNFAVSQNTEGLASDKRLQEAEFNRMLMYPSMQMKDTRSFVNEREEDNDYFEYLNQKFFDDETGEDTVEIERDNYNPYVLSKNIDIWNPMQDEELFDYSDFTGKHLQDVQKIEQSKIYPEENKFSTDDDNEDMILKEKAHTDIRTPVINAYNVYILPRHLNILEDAEYPTDESLQLPTRIQNDILRANPMEVTNERFFEEPITRNNARVQDLILYKGMGEYSKPAINTQKNIRDNTQNHDLTLFDPDLLEEIEVPPMEPTEPTPREFSTPRQQ